MSTGSVTSSHGQVVRWPISHFRSCMVRFFVVHCTYPSINPFLIKDALALLIIVYSAKRHGRGLTRVGGAPSLLSKILHDATMYFLVISTGHLLLVLTDIFAPVSEPVNLRSTAHNRPLIGCDQTSPCGVSRRPEYCDEGESNRTRSYP